MKKIITYIIYIFIIIISVSFFFKIDYPHKKINFHWFFNITFSNGRILFFTKK